MRLLKFFLKKSSSGWFEKVLSWIGLGLNLGFRIWWISGRSKIGDTVSWTLTVWYRTTVYGNGRTAVLAAALQGSRVYVGRLCWWVHVIKDVWRKFTHNPAQRGVVLKLFIDFDLNSSSPPIPLSVCVTFCLQWVSFPQLNSFFLFVSSKWRLKITQRTLTTSEMRIPSGLEQNQFQHASPTDPV